MRYSTDTIEQLELVRQIDARNKLVARMLRQKRKAQSSLEALKLDNRAQVFRKEIRELNQKYFSIEDAKA